MKPTRSASMRPAGKQSSKWVAGGAHANNRWRKDLMETCIGMQLSSAAQRTHLRPTATLLQQTKILLSTEVWTVECRKWLPLTVWPPTHRAETGVCVPTISHSPRLPSADLALGWPH